MSLILDLTPILAAVQSIPGLISAALADITTRLDALQASADDHGAALARLETDMAGLMAAQAACAGGSPEVLPDPRAVDFLNTGLIEVGQLGGATVPIGVAWTALCGVNRDGGGGTQPIFGHVDSFGNGGQFFLRANSLHIEIGARQDTNSATQMTIWRMNTVLPASGSSSVVAKFDGTNGGAAFNCHVDGVIAASKTYAGVSGTSVYSSGPMSIGTSGTTRTVNDLWCLGYCAANLSDTDSVAACALIDSGDYIGESSALLTLLKGYSADSWIMAIVSTDDLTTEVKVYGRALQGVPSGLTGANLITVPT